jgi:uncharacterized protein YdaU (DUF1376 family)
MHYYTFNVGDYRKDTGHLSTLEHGIYRQLLDWYYLDEKPIPQETQVVLRRLRLGSYSDISALQNVLTDFFVLQADGYHQTRCDADIAAYQSKAEVNKINGKLGGRPKKTQVVLVGLPDETQNNLNQEPITINQEPKKKATVVATPEGVSQSVWDEFIAHRKAKKAKVTDLVIEGITKEASKAGWSLEDALKETIVRNWQSFKADWVINQNNVRSGSFANRSADIAHMTTPPPPNQDAALRKIEEDSKRAAKPNADVQAKINELLNRKVV